MATTPWNPLPYRCPYCHAKIVMWTEYALHLRKHRLGRISKRNAGGGK